MQQSAFPGYVHSDSLLKYHGDIAAVGSVIANHDNACKNKTIISPVQLKITVGMPEMYSFAIIDIFQVNEVRYRQPIVVWLSMVTK